VAQKDHSEIELLQTDVLNTALCSA